MSSYSWSLSLVQGTKLTINLLIEEANRIGLTAFDSGQLVTVDAYPNYIEITINTPIDVNEIGTYTNAITYTVRSRLGMGILTSIYRDIIITPKPEIEVYKPIDYGNCPCPIFYKPIQDNYKLGSYASNKMKYAGLILRGKRNR